MHFDTSLPPVPPRHHFLQLLQALSHLGVGRVDPGAVSRPIEEMFGDALGFGKMMVSWDLMGSNGIS